MSRLSFVSTTLLFKIIVIASVWLLSSLAWCVDEPKPVLVAYLPSYRIAHITDEQCRGITDIIYFGIEPSADGKLPDSIFPEQVSARLQKIKQQHGSKILLCVGGWGRSKHFPVVTSQEESRHRLVESLQRVCRQYGFDGIDYDWEHPADPAQLAQYRQLLQDTKTAFVADNLLVTIAQASWQDIGQAGYAAVDRVHCMSYDHKFPQATLAKSQQDVEQLIAWGCPAQKIVLGVPFYGRNEKREARTYAELIAAGTPDESSDIIDGYAYNGKKTIANKVAYVRQKHLAGVMIWEIGQDATDEKQSLLNVVKTNLFTIK